jgi:hypothetical protein
MAAPWVMPPDAAGNDVAPGLGIPESPPVGHFELVEHIGLDQRQVVADARPAARGEGADTVGVAEARIRGPVGSGGNSTSSMPSA